MARSEYRTRKRITESAIAGWIRTVERRAIPVCADQVALAAHVKRVFATERLRIDRERLARYLGYQRYFPFDLAEEERFLLALWLCVYGEDGLPRWPDLLLYVCRGWGKTSFAAFCAFCLISPANGIPAYDVDICATTEDQARIGYLDLWRIMEASPDLFSQGFTWNKIELSCLETQSRYKFWSGNSNSKDGMRSGAGFFDEVHAYEDNASMEVFTGGLGKKDEPRRLMTTTDGTVRDGPLDEMKGRARAILEDGEPDGGFLPFMCRLDDPREIEDESLWPKANPRLLTSKSLMAEYRREVAEWRISPARHPMVLTKRFNLPEQRRDIAVTSWANLVAASRPVEAERLRGLPCVAGVDYALVTDMVGACLLFRVGDGEYASVTHAWWCTRSADAGEVKAPLGDWAAAGLLTEVDGVEIPTEDVARWIRSTADSLGARIECVAADTYRFSLMRRAIVDVIGMDETLRGADQQVWLTRPSDIMRVQPVIDSAFARRAIAWGENPLMRWAANNAKLEPAPNGNFRYGKIEPHSRKTDPFMALVHAFTVADRIPEDAPAAFAEPVFW